MRDISASDRPPDYEAVDVLWVALVKAANQVPGRTERDRMLTLVNGIPIASARTVLGLPALDTLLRLEPPLETILADRNERLDPDGSAKALAKVRSYRELDPLAALSALGEVLKRIRNKRAHGLKSRSGPRDAEILGAAHQILRSLSLLAITND